MQTIHAFIDITTRFAFGLVLKFCETIITITFKTTIKVVAITVHTRVGITFIDITASETITGESKITFTCE